MQNRKNPAGLAPVPEGAATLQPAADRKQDVTSMPRLPATFTTGYRRDLEVARELIRKRREGGKRSANGPTA